MFLTPYGKTQWITILIGTFVLGAGCVGIHFYLLLIPVIIGSLVLLSFFRDPERSIPIQKDIMVSPCDGRISSIHDVENYEPLGGPAVCVRVFLSVADVHVNRSPCLGSVQSVSRKAGQYLNALNPHSAEVNASNTIVLVHPIQKTPVAAVRQIAGLIARTIVCDLHIGDTLQRGQRFGMIKFGSTTELYVPKSFRPQVVVRQGQYVYGGETVLVQLNPVLATDPESVPPAE